MNRTRRPLVPEDLHRNSRSGQRIRNAEANRRARKVLEDARLQRRARWLVVKAIALRILRRGGDEQRVAKHLRDRDG